MFGQSLSQVTGSMPTFSGTNPGAEALGKVGQHKPAQQATQDPMSGAYQISDPSQIIDPGATMMSAHGGKVKAMVSPGEKFLKPNEAKAVADGKVDPMKVGENIPGKAKVKGDSYSNDTVPKDLAVGGIVIPKSIMESKNPGPKAKSFVEAWLKRNTA